MPDTNKLNRDNKISHKN